MKAITYSRYGGPEVLQVSDIDRPVAKNDEILIRVHAAEATKSDCEMRSFRFAVNWFWLPLRIAFGITKPRRRVLGGYFAGEVAETGRDVTGFAVGDEVFGCASLRFGGYGEYVALPASFTIVPKPRNFGFADAAAVPLGGLNALHFLRRVQVRPGERVLINGAGGSIGLHGVQIARAMGAHVTAVDTSIKRDVVMRMGADEFIDYKNEDFTRRDEKWDVLFDMVPGTDYASCIRSLGPGGRYASGNPRLAVILRSMLTNWFTDKTATCAFAGESKEELLALKDMIEAGEVISIVERVYPMEQAAQAHRRVETEERMGSVVIAIHPGGNTNY